MCLCVLFFFFLYYLKINTKTSSVDIMTTSYPNMVPMDSDKFLSPTFGEHATGDAKLKEQNEDRERMVCAVGLDVHYELNVIAKEIGSFKPRYKPFNPRISGPACPYNYTGRFVDEKHHEELEDDPIALARLIEKKTPYDTLYNVRDPRLVSKTVVVRDYGCKVPIEIGEVEKIAKAVLAHYPDQYVSFLGEFVNNLFGESMRSFLQKQQDGLQKLIDQPDELNRVSWSAYIAVQGGIDMEDPGTIHRRHDGDVTLKYSKGMGEALNKLTNDGRAMTGQCSSQDVFDLRPCLNQHIETLKTMKNTYCRGFGSKEQHVLAMLWYANEQGIKMCADLQLIQEDESLEYRKITMHVPYSFLDSDTDGSTTDLCPDMCPSINGDLKEKARICHATKTVTYPVGQWSGNSDSAVVFVGAGSKSQFQWGWGHAANTGKIVDGVQNLTTSVTPPNMLAVPYLPYIQSSVNNNVSLNTQLAPEGKAYVRQDRWGDSFKKITENTFKVGKEITKGNLRDSIDAELTSIENKHLYKGVTTADMLDHPNIDRTSPGERNGTINQNRVFCSDLNSVQIVDKDLYPESDYMDPFFNGLCVPSDDSGSYIFNKDIGPYNIEDMKGKQKFKQLLGNTTLSINSSITKAEERFLTEASPILMQLYTYSKLYTLSLSDTATVHDAHISSAIGMKYTSYPFELMSPPGRPPRVYTTRFKNSAYKHLYIKYPINGDDVKDTEKLMGDCNPIYRILKRWQLDDVNDTTREIPDTIVGMFNKCWDLTKGGGRFPDPRPGGEDGILDLGADFIIRLNPNLSIETRLMYLRHHISERGRHHGELYVRKEVIDIDQRYTTDRFYNEFIESINVPIHHLPYYSFTNHLIKKLHDDVFNIWTTHINDICTFGKLSLKDQPVGRYDHEIIPIADVGIRDVLGPAATRVLCQTSSIINATSSKDAFSTKIVVGYDRVFTRCDKIIIQTRIWTPRKSFSLQNK